MKQTTVVDKSLVRALVRGTYDIQQLRIQEGNRIVANYKAKLGMSPSATESEAEEFAKNCLKSLRDDYDRITDGIVLLPKPQAFTAQGIISSYGELCLVHAYMSILKNENDMFKQFPKVLIDIPIYKEYLKDVVGIGPAIAGIIISEMDPHRATYPSSFWKYAGLDVAPDGRGRGRYKDHLVEREYEDSEGETQVRMGITFNPWLKTKLLGVLAASFVKCGNHIYAPMYYEYKVRLENHPAHKEKTKLHRHRMALRYIVKRFLVDLHITWRQMEDLPVYAEYSEAKLGLIHKKAA